METSTLNGVLRRPVGRRRRAVRALGPGTRWRRGARAALVQIVSSLVLLVGLAGVAGAQTATLTVNITGEAAFGLGGTAGRVTSSPAGIDCRADVPNTGACAASFAAGTAVTLTAAPPGARSASPAPSPSPRTRRSRPASSHRRASSQ